VNDATIRGFVSFALTRRNILIVRSLSTPTYISGCGDWLSRPPKSAALLRAIQPRGVRYALREPCFWSIRIDGITYKHDILIDRGEVPKRKKKASKKFRDERRHTPLLADEEIPRKRRC